MEASSCPQCGSGVLADDRFCEACGRRLAEDDAVAGQALSGGATAAAEVGAGTNGAMVAGEVAGPAATAGCRGCGAAPGAIDADGYCGVCGLHQPSSRDHHEVDCGWASGVTDKGRRHPRNEDALYLEVCGSGLVAVVCDGVSSTAASDTASQAAADAAGHLLASALQDRPDQLEAATIEATAAAQQAVTSVRWQGGPDLGAPSSTFVSAVSNGKAVTVGWVGDSRAYWLEPAGLRQLTVDDSWAEQQVQAGTMTSEEAEADSRAHTITRWLGTDAPMDGGPGLRTFRPAGPGRLLLCTDGLWNYAPTPEALADAIGGRPAGASTLDLARHLTDFALNAGGHDNITVIIADLPERPRGAP